MYNFDIAYKVFLAKIDPYGITYYILGIACIYTLLFMHGENFMCPHCKNSLKKRGIFTWIYVKGHGKNCEKQLKCPFCKEEHLCKHISEI